MYGCKFHTLNALIVTKLFRNNHFICVSGAFMLILLSLAHSIVKISLPKISDHEQHCSRNRTLVRKIIDFLLNFKTRLLVLRHSGYSRVSVVWKVTESRLPDASGQ